MKWLVTVVSVVVLAGVGLAFAPSFMDWNSYKADIEAQISARSGGVTALNGDISVHLLPAPKLTAGDVTWTFPDPSTTSQPARLQVREMDLEFELVAFLTGGMRIKSVRLHEPEIMLPVGFSFDSPTPSREQSDTTTAAASGFAIDQIELIDGRILQVQAEQAARVIGSGIQATGSAATLHGPFQFKGSGDVYGQALEFAFASAAYREQQPTAVRVNLKHPGQQGEAVITGAVTSQANGSWAFAGKLKGQVDLSAANAETPAEAAPLIVNLSSDVEANLNAPITLQLKDAAVRFGAARGSGHFSYRFTETPEIDFAFRLNRVPGDWVQTLVQQSGFGTDEAPASAALASLLDLMPSEVPEAVGRAEIVIDSVEFPQGYVRQIQTHATFGAGSINIDNFSALFPGSSQIQIDGLWSGGPPRFNGAVHATSNDLRSFLTWLGVDTAGVRAGRLTNLSFASELQINDGLLQLGRIDLQLDRTAFNGGLALLLDGIANGRPSFGISISGDQFNLDGYMPLTKTRTGADDAAPATQSRLGQMIGLGPHFDLATLAAAAPLLDRFDANLLINIGELTYSETPIRGLRLDLSLVNGALDLRQLTVAEYEGSSLTLSGTGQDFSEQPAVIMNAELQAQDLGRLLGNTDLATARTLSQMGPLAFNGQLEGGFDKLRIEGAAEIVGMEAAVDAAISDLTQEAEVDATLSGRHPHLAALLSFLGAEVNPDAGSIEPIDVVLDVIRRDTQMALEFEGILKDGRVEARGTLENTDQSQPAVNAHLHIRHQNLVQFLEALGFDAGAHISDGIPLNLTIAADGTLERMLLPAFDVVLASSKISLNDGKVLYDDGRPAISGTVTADPIILDILLKTELTNTAVGTAASENRELQPGQEWSRDPFDWSLLSAFDADVTLKADLIQYGLYVFAAPEGHLQLKSGTLTVSDLKGRLFGGEISLNGGLAMGTLPSLNGKVDLKNADLGLAFLALFDSDAIAGDGMIDIDVNTYGNSIFDLVNGMRGQVQIASNGGMLRGLDIRGFAALFEEGSSADNLAPFISGLFTGESEFQRLESSWILSAGVAETSATQITFSNSVIDSTGSVDLRTGERDLISNLIATQPSTAAEIYPQLRFYNQGTLDSPKRRLDVTAIRQFLFERAQKYQATGNARSELRRPQ